MRTFWAKKNNSEHLILFFNGWGMDENVVNHLSSDSDILIIYDYSDLSFNQDISTYKEVTLIAWSLGVFIASQVVQNLSNIKRSIAINGTLLPIDKDFGIDPKIFQLTLDNMSESTRDKFFAKMVSSEKVRFISPNREVESQTQELAYIKKVFQGSNFGYSNFDVAMVSDKDKIIPTKNQVSYWGKKSVEVIKLNSGHYPFFKFESWDELINETL